MDGSVATKAIQIHRVAPCVRAGPPRAGPCESLPGAALWGNILRVLYLHDNAIPKNQLWRNGRKPGEVIGCRLGEGGGTGSPASLRGMEGKGGWRRGLAEKGGATKKSCCRNIKQAARSNITVSSISDPPVADPRKRTESQRRAAARAAKVLRAAGRAGEDHPPD